jgi:site-specific DNA recombinase
MTKSAALYLRQSKADDQGIERQLARTRSLAELRGWTVAGEYVDDDISASKARGSGTAWARMLEDADAGLVEVVVGVDLDRLLRSTRDLNTLIDHNLQVVTVDGEIDLSTADGEFRATMLAGLARFEVRRKGERQTRANTQRAAGGGVPKGARLTGYTTDGELIDDEAVAVRAMFHGFLAGETLRSLARDHSLSPSTVRTILVNPRYAGRRVYKAEVVGKGSWESIVSEDEFDIVQRRLADPARRMNRTGSTARRALGTSLFRCAECADHPTLRTAGSGGRYWCPQCGTTRKMMPIDDLVLAVLYDRLSRPYARAALTPDEDTHVLQVSAQSLRERRDGIAELLADGLLAPAAARAQLEKLREQIEATEYQIDRSSNPAQLLTEEELAAGLDALSLDRRRALVDELIEVYVGRAPRGNKGFDPATIRIEPKG